MLSHIFICMLYVTVLSVYDLPKCSIHCHRRDQNTAARILTYTAPSSHITLVMKIISSSHFTFVYNEIPSPHVTCNKISSLNSLIFELNLFVARYSCNEISSSHITLVMKSLRKILSCLMKSLCHT